MAEIGPEGLQELAIKVSEVRSACRLLSLLAEVLETREPDSREERMAIYEGIGFALDSLAERLRDVQRELSRD